ncbi:hypothetical protein Tco_1373119, partial [Tanacetum coccineum]
FYTRLVKDVKVYIPSGLFEPYVTVRYLDWWNKSAGECSLQSPIDDNKTDKFGKDESSIEGSEDSMDVDTMGFELEARISKLEEIFAYLKAKKNGETIEVVAGGNTCLHAFLLAPMRCLSAIGKTCWDTLLRLLVLEEEASQVDDAVGRVCLNDLFRLLLLKEDKKQHADWVLSHHVIRCSNSPTTITSIVIPWLMTLRHNSEYGLWYLAMLFLHLRWFGHVKLRRHGQFAQP